MTHQLSFGTIYWMNPHKKKLEFLCAKKQGKGDIYSLFYHTSDNYHSKFYGDLLGLVCPFDEFTKILSTMTPPHYKTNVGGNGTVYYINIPYNPILVNALNGFKTYLSKCVNSPGIVANCSKYPFSVYSDFLMADVDQMKSLIASKKFGQSDLVVLANFDSLSKTLESNLNIKKLSTTKGAQKFFDKIKKNKKMLISSASTDPKYINQLLNEHTAYIKTLKPEYIEAIQQYTGTMSTPINNYLRGENDPMNPLHPSSEQQIKKYINDINQALNNAPPTTQDIVVYRGMKFDNLAKFHNLKVGQLIDIFRDNFNSCSFDLTVSSGVAFTGSQCCVFILHLPAGVKGLYVKQASLHQSEDEFILAPGPLFRVMKFKHEKNPQMGLVPTKPNLRYYRLYCEDCQQAYEKYNNIVYYQLSHPAFAITKTPTKNSVISPTHSAIDIHGKIIPKKIDFIKTKDLETDKSLLVHSKFTTNKPSFPQTLIKANMPKPISLSDLRKVDDVMTPSVRDFLKLSQVDMYIYQLSIQSKVISKLSNEWKSPNGLGQNILEKSIKFISGIENFISHIYRIFDKQLPYISPFIKYKTHTRNFLMIYLVKSQNQMLDLMDDQSLIPIDHFLSKYDNIINHLDQFTPQSSQIYQIISGHSHLTSTYIAIPSPSDFLIYYSYINQLGLLGVRLIAVLEQIAHKIIKVKVNDIYNPLTKQAINYHYDITNLDNNSFIPLICKTIYDNKTPSSGFEQDFSKKNKLSIISKRFINFFRKDKMIINGPNSFNFSIDTPIGVNLIELSQLLLPEFGLDYIFADKIGNQYLIETENENGVNVYNKIFESNIKCMQQGVVGDFFMNPLNGKCEPESTLIKGKSIVRYIINPTDETPKPSTIASISTNTNTNPLQDTSHFDPTDIEGLPPYVISQLLELAKDCGGVKNFIKNPASGVCLNMNSLKGKKIVHKLFANVGDLSLSSNVSVSNIDTKNLVGLSDYVIAELTKFSKGCPPNKIKSPLTGNCVVMSTASGQKVVTYFKNTEMVINYLKSLIKNIDSQYLNDLSLPVLSQLVQKSKWCPKNQFMSSVSNKCIVISGSTGKKALLEMDYTSTSGSLHDFNIELAYKMLPSIDKSLLDDVDLKTMEQLLSLVVLSQECPQNHLKNPNTGVCELIDGKIGKLIFQEIKSGKLSIEKCLDGVKNKPTKLPGVSPQTVILPKNIDQVHLKDFSPTVILEIAKLAEGCPQNKIHNPHSGNCILIMSSHAKKVINEIKALVDK